MRINWIEITRGSGHILRKCEFADFTLLVGKTGVGKSEILSGIHFFKRLLDPNPLNKGVFRKQAANSYIGNQMRISFDADGEEFTYEVELDKEGKSGCRIARESLTGNAGQLFYRDMDTARFLSYGKLPRAAADRSLLLTFSEEPLCKRILAHFAQMYYFTDVFKSKETMRYIKTLAAISKSDEDAFGEIKALYFSIFNDLTDISFDYNDFGCPFVKILHADGTWVGQSDISAGMLKTLTFIVLLKTAVGPSVLLIDEIENSLGVNCLDVVVEELGYATGIQCITTSHHPYVINNISPDKWKVVSRNGAEISVRNAEDLGIGDTSHDSFYQLINAYNFEEA